MKRCLLVCIIMTTIILSAEISARTIRRAKVNKIIDANTIIVRESPQDLKVFTNAGSVKDVTVSLYGIYTPESSTDIFLTAKNYLTREIFNKRVTVYVEEEISKHSVIGRVRAPGTRDVGEQLVEFGLARSNDDEKYEKAEENAKRKGLGLWEKKEVIPEMLDLQKPISEMGKIFKLELSGNDRIYKFANGPNRFLVYRKSRDGTILKQFIIAGINPDIITLLRPGDRKTVIVQVMKNQKVKFPSGTIKVFPVLKIVGKNRVLGVGGELMYYK